VESQEIKPPPAHVLPVVEPSPICPFKPEDEEVHPEQVLAVAAPLLLLPDHQFGEERRPVLIKLMTIWDVPPANILLQTLFNNSPLAEVDVVPGLKPYLVGKSEI
jgi:hypothetical protein